MEVSDQQRALEIFQTNQGFFVDPLVKQKKFSSYYVQNGWEENLREFSEEFTSFLYRICLTVESENATFKESKPLIYLYRKQNFSIQDGLLSSQEFCHWLIENENHPVMLVYSKPQLLKNNYKKLDGLDLNPTEYAEYSDKVKSDPLRFEVNYQKLQRLGLDSKKYVTKILDDPARFQASYQKLQCLGLNTKEYVIKILDDLETFEANYQKLQCLGLDADKYVAMMLDDLETFEKKYKILENIHDMELTHGAYDVFILESSALKDEIIHNFEHRLDIFKRHERLGIVCTETISKVVAEGDFEFLSGMTRRLELIQKSLQKQIEKIKIKIGAGPRVDGLNRYKDEFMHHVLLTCFRFYMTKIYSDHYMDFKNELGSHMNTFLRDSQLAEDKSSTGKVKRQTMSVGSNVLSTLLLFGPLYGLYKHGGDNDKSILKIMFPFFRQTKSAESIASGINSILKEPPDRYEDGDNEVPKGVTMRCPEG